MAIVAHKLLWFFIYSCFFLIAARIDFYYKFTEGIIFKPFVSDFARLLGVFPDGESMINFREWIGIHLIILLSLIPYSIVRAVSNFMKCEKKSLYIFTKEWIATFSMVFLITISVLLAINIILEI